ncbi:hypothetical protein [Streptomyces sp. NPDC090025]|uniref:hypothetical protein n=1 Tax=Streptomyces sp. NPDC090025 TaxID=3365922 RepID=UPI0038361A6D
MDIARHGPVMTLRVSRDNGHTFGPMVTVDPGTPLLDNPMAFPPCDCPLHSEVTKTTAVRGTGLSGAEKDS